MEVYSADTLEWIKRLGQTSSHCFDAHQPIDLDNGNILYLDMGDGFPRGLQIHEMSAEDPLEPTRDARLVLAAAGTPPSSHTRRPPSKRRQLLYPVQ